ncbi:MAG: cohesin domain-containing protein [Candidatus Bathyarchaeia archaeon]
MYKEISIMSLLMLIFLLTPIPLSFSQTTNVYVDPPLTITQIDETFSINISIAQVTNLAAWEIKLYYLNTMLNGTKATEGPFLKTAGLTFFWVLSFTDNYNATHGKVHIACTLTGTGPGATGSGTLATVTFKAKNAGNTPLTLKDTKLLDNQDPPQQIIHTAINGDVQVRGIRDIAVLNVNPFKTIVGQGYTIQINVTVVNNGDQAETFNVTLYANTTGIETRQITLINGVSTTLTFTWNTIGYQKGSYTIWAYAWPVQGETEIDDNIFISPTIVHVVLPGDGDCDGDVDIYDVVMITSIYNLKSGDPYYNPNLDWDNNGVINIYDVVIATSVYGQKDP